MKTFRQILLLVLSTTALFFFTGSFASQDQLTLTISGEILDYRPVNLDADPDDEFLVIYDNLFDKRFHAAVIDISGDGLKKIADIQIDSRFTFYFTAHIESNTWENIVFGGSTAFAYVSLQQNGGQLVPLLKTQTIYTTPFASNFPYINCAFDIDKDGYSEFIIPTFDGLKIFRKDVELTHLPYDLSSLYNFKLSLGGFNTVNTITMVVPDILLEDINADGNDDLLLIYRDKIEYYFHEPVSPYFIKRQSLNLSKYVNIRSGYSPFNRHIEVLDYDGDGIMDVLVFNFSMAAVFNTDKLGTVCYIFKGKKDAPFWRSESDKQIYMDGISGIESKFYFVDVNGDKRLDLVNFGSKLFSTNFVLTLTMKRSMPFTFSVYAQTPQNSLQPDALYSLDKSLSLDTTSVTDSTQADFNFYGSADLTLILNRILVNYTTDLNGDSIPDLVMYNFDGTYSVYLSDRNLATVYPKKPDKIISLSSDFLKIFYINGPYNSIVPVKSGFYLFAVSKMAGKIYAAKL